MDLIERQAAIEAVKGRFSMPVDNLIVEVIGKLPPAEPKTGEWTSHSVGHAHIPWGFDCSNCKKWVVIGKDIIKEYKFCPNCGARMEGENDA